MVADVKGSHPRLLSEGHSDEVAELDQLLIGEVQMKPRPEFVVVGRRIPGDRPRVCEGRSLALVVAA